MKHLGEALAYSNTWIMPHAMSNVAFTVKHLRGLYCMFNLQAHLGFPCLTLKPGSSEFVCLELST